MRSEEVCVSRPTQHNAFPPSQSLTAPKRNIHTYTYIQYCKGDFIFHLDSDVVLHRPVLYKDLFLRGLPMLEYDTYDNLRDTGASRWQLGTAFAVGHSPILYEYSRSNEHLYPREMYAPARAHIERRFKGIRFADYLATRPGSSKGKSTAKYRKLEARYLPEGEKDSVSLFSDFNYAGTWLFVLGRPCVCGMNQLIN